MPSFCFLAVLRSFVTFFIYCYIPLWDVRWLSIVICFNLGFPCGSDDKESSCNAGDPGSIPGSGRFPPPQEEVATHSSILAWKFHGQRSLVGHSLWGHKELDMAEWLTQQFFNFLLYESTVGLCYYHGAYIK